MLQGTLPAGFIAPCLPTKTDRLPSGSQWLHEIKHDGFRVIARKDGDRVRLYSRPGNDMTRRFPLIAEALTGLRSRSCIIDGEAVACDDNGLASFERIRYRQHDGDVFLYAFDLIELNGNDLRRDPLQVRKATLRSMLAKAGLGLRFNEHMEGDGPTIFAGRAHPCNISNNPPRLRATTSSPYGADYAMPNLLNHLAAPSCSRLGSHWDYVEPKGGNHPRRN